MYVEKRKYYAKTKYWLAHSFREGGKIHKIRKLLGTDLSEEILEDRIKKAEKLILEEIEKYKIIKDPLNDKISKEEINFIKRLQTEANLKIVHLSETDWKTFSEVFSYNTNAIEGSGLTLKETEKIIEKGEWPIEKPKEDIAEALGVDEAISFIRKTKEHISLDLIKKFHQIVFKNSKNFAGEFRKRGEEVVVRTGTGVVVHEGAPSTRVTTLLTELIAWYNKYKNDYPGILLAAVVHNQFENIHPFADGNGRVGRILLNNILLKNNLPPLNIDLKNQREYYATLQTYENDGNIRPTIELILKEYKNLKKLIK
ncbi:Fic family protein [Candidatus Pacearchaeota archaeon]|nr:Fic family protein [Candidatus Pacearchaeota archaeon]